MTERDYKMASSSWQSVLQHVRKMTVMRQRLPIQCTLMLCVWFFFPFSMFLAQPLSRQWLSVSRKTMESTTGSAGLSFLSVQPWTWMELLFFSAWQPCSLLSWTMLTSMLGKSSLFCKLLAIVTTSFWPPDTLKPVVSLLIASSLHSTSLTSS